MEELRSIPAPLVVVFERIDSDEGEFRREFDSLSEATDDPLSQWLKLAKARGETKESDPVVLTLLVELHRKVDALTREIEGGESDLLVLPAKGRITGINYEHFILEDPLLDAGSRYYGRIDLPAFPQREVPLFFNASEPTVGHLELMHERDRKDWNSYVASRERAMIREMKGLQ